MTTADTRVPGRGHRRPPLPSELRAAVRHAGVPVLLVQPGPRRIVEVSDAAADAVGLARSDLIDGPLDRILDPDALNDTMTLLRTRIDGFWTRTTIRRGDRETFASDLVVRRYDYGEGRLLLVVLSPPGLLDTATAEPVRRAGRSQMAVGDLDEQWRIAHISADISALLGQRAAALVGTSLLALVFPADLPDVLAALGKSADSGSTEWVTSRLRTAGGVWRTCLLMVAALSATPPPGEHVRSGSNSRPPAGAVDGRRFAFVLTPDDPAAVTEAPAHEMASRLAELERRLWAVGQQVRAAGLMQGSGLPQAVTDLPGASKLSPREWEILNQALTGRRATAIARALVLSPSTVRNHLTSIYGKLGVGSQNELLELARPHNTTRVLRGSTAGGEPGAGK